MSKKVLGICVSSRKNGNSSIILNELLRPRQRSRPPNRNAEFWIAADFAVYRLLWL